MPTLKYFDETTQTWKRLVQGPKGEQGIQGEVGDVGPVGPIGPLALYVQDDQPDTSIPPTGTYPLWLDSDAEPPAVALEVDLAATQADADAAQAAADAAQAAADAAQADADTAQAAANTAQTTANTGVTNAATAQAAAEARVLKAGDTMTGLLTLSGVPTATNHAATKGYVDARIWFGTAAQYAAISPKDATVLYVVSG